MLRRLKSEDPASRSAGDFPSMTLLETNKHERLYPLEMWDELEAAWAPTVLELVVVAVPWRELYFLGFVFFREFLLCNLHDHMSSIESSINSICN